MDGRQYDYVCGTLYAFAGPTPPSTSIHGFTPWRERMQIDIMHNIQVGVGMGGTKIIDKQ